MPEFPGCENYSFKYPSIIPYFFRIDRTGGGPGPTDCTNGYINGTMSFDGSGWKSAAPTGDGPAGMQGSIYSANGVTTGIVSYDSENCSFQVSKSIAGSCAPAMGDSEEVELSCCPGAVSGIAQVSWGIQPLGIPIPTSTCNEQFPPTCCSCVTNPKPNSNGGLNPKTGLIDLFSSAPVRYSSGEIRLTSTDIASGGFGMSWGHTRGFASRMSFTQTVGQGYNWQVAQWAYLVVKDNGTVVVQGEPNSAIWFDKVDNVYQPRYGLKQTLVLDTVENRYRLTNLDGSVTEFDAFTGMFRRKTDPYGNQITVTAMNSNGYNFNQVQRTYTASGVTTTEQFEYTYSTTSGDALLSQVTLKRKIGAGSWDNVSQAHYTYYGYNDPYGLPGDLKTARVEQWQSGAWEDSGTTYYRYWLELPSGSSSSSSSSSGSPSAPFAHLIKYVVKPSSFAKLVADPNVSDPFTASDAIVALYADNYYEYDSERRVTREMTDGGSRTFTFDYFQSSFAEDYISWKFKTIEGLPDGSQKIVYANYAGQTMLQVHESGADQWCEFWKYNQDAHVILHAHPSAISGYDDQYPDLLHGVDEHYEFLRDDAGLIETYDIHAPTGWVSSEKIQQGQLGTCIRLRDYEYTPFYAGGGSGGSSSSSGSSGSPSGQPVYFLTQTTVYPEDGCTCDGEDLLVEPCGSGCCSNDLTRTIVETYDYTFYSGTTQVQQKTTTLPVISTEQNGSGEAVTRKAYFDTYGNLTWSMDERGFITRMEYDIPTGAVTRRVDDVDTSVESGAPSGWETPSGGGLNLVSNFEHDAQGRITQSLGPVHEIDLEGTATEVRRASWTVFDDANHITYSGQGYATGDSPDYDFTLMNPVSITQMDPGGKVLEQIQATAPATSGTLAEIIDNAGGGTAAFPQTSYTRWTTYQYTDCCLAASQRIYHTIPASGAGDPGTNYDETSYGYDAMKRRVRTVSPGGTISWQVYDVRSQVIASYLGTDDTGATDQDPTGGGALGNNMVLISENVYDDGQAGGDGNLTQVTQHIDALTTRVTSYLYDWRDRRTATDGEIDLYETVCYDNLNRVLRSDRRDTTANGNLIARSETLYDDQSRVYRSLRYGVDPTTGTLGNVLTDNSWYDAGGHLIKNQPSGSKLFSKTTYDSLGRSVASYTGYDLDETAYSAALSVSDDVILEQSESLYDNASNLIQSTQRQRYHNAPANQTGPLHDPATTPKARVTYSAMWPDPLGRTQAAADYGTNGGVALSRSDVIPTRSDTVLVSSTAYNDAGEVFETTDPAGMITRMANDAAGREIQRIMNYQASSSSGGGGAGCEDSSDTNVTVEMTYTADGNLSTLTALNAYTGNQTTQYIYGTTLADSGIATSALKRQEIYPDSVDSDDVILFGYNRQSQIVKITDQAGTVHEFDYDLLGRQTQDRVTTLGSGVDGAVRRIATTYEVRGMKSRLTSYDNPTVGMGGIVNDGQYLYNDFSQLVTEYQSHSGAVNTGSSPQVQYDYADGAENTIRPLTLTYPNGRELHSDYGATDSIDDAASRVASLVDDGGTTHLADYSYLGSGSFVEADYTEPETKYTLVGTAGGNDPETGDIYRGLDRFGRVKDSYWYDYGSSSDTDRIKYGYDRVGNRTYRENTVATAAGKEFDEQYLYDQIHRLKTMDRGTLNGTHTGLTSTTFGQCWTLDETGNWRGFREDDTGDGTWDLVQARTANPVNEITDITESAGPSWFAPGYNRAGNMTAMPQPLALTSSYSATYDAWNRLVKLAAGADTVSEYAYDGAKRRIVQKSYTAGVLSETRHYYLTAGWQTIEERIDSETTAERQFVWGQRYIDDCVLRDRDSDDNGTLDERLYALQDANWNVTGLIDPTGAVQERMAYTAYGVPLFLDAAFVPTTDSYDWDNLYCGYRYEPASGLFHVRHRVLHPALGNWIQRDPIGYADGANLYGAYFVPGDVDPSGLAPGGHFRRRGPRPMPRPPAGPPPLIPPVPIPPKTDRDKVRQMIENAGCSSTCKKDLELLFKEIDNIEATTPFDPGAGPCGTFAQEFMLNKKKANSPLAGLTCATIEQKYYHIIPPIWNLRGGSTDYHHVIKITMQCNNCPVTFYLDAGTQWSGDWTGNQGGDDNVFLKLPKRLVPTLGTGDGFPTDAEFDKLCRAYKGW